VIDAVFDYVFNAWDRTAALKSGPEHRHRALGIQVGFRATAGGFMPTGWPITCSPATVNGGSKQLLREAYNR
jgi:hypothetical protein